jgi:hypothetical protein
MSEIGEATEAMKEQPRAGKWVKLSGRGEAAEAKTADSGSRAAREVRRYPNCNLNGPWNQDRRGH